MTAPEVQTTLSPVDGSVVAERPLQIAGAVPSGPVEQGEAADEERRSTEPTPQLRARARWRALRGERLGGG